MICVLPIVTLLLATDPVSEHEPNQTRETASPATAGTGGSITGICRGFETAPDSINDDTRDIWRITLTANPQAIQRHTLQVSTTGNQGHTGTIVGVQSNAGVIDTASMVSLQSTSINTVPARYCAVYTIGNASPSFLYRMTGSSGTTAPYIVDVASQTITPLEASACPFAAGPITISSVGRTTLNTKVFLFNGETMTPIEGGVNDDAILGTSGTSPQFTLTRTLAPGRYIIAVGNGGTVDNRQPPSDDRLSTQASWFLTESPGLLVNGSSTATGDFSFSIVDTYGSRNVTATKPAAFGMVFFRFTVETRCGWADVGRQGGEPCSDNQLNNNDFVSYVSAFFAANMPVADLGSVGGAVGRDGRLDNNDWIVFLDDFFIGCTP